MNVKSRLDCREKKEIENKFFFLIEFNLAAKSAYNLY